MFSRLFELPRNLFTKKVSARKQQRSKFLMVESLEARQLLSATGFGDDSDFTPRIINAQDGSAPVDLNWSTVYNSVVPFSSSVTTTATNVKNRTPTTGDPSTTVTNVTTNTATTVVGAGTIVKATETEIWILTSAQLAKDMVTPPAAKTTKTGARSTPSGETTTVVSQGIGSVTVGSTVYALDAGGVSVVIHSKYTPLLGTTNNLGNATANDVALVRISGDFSAQVAAPMLETALIAPTSKQSALAMKLVGFGETGTPTGGEVAGTSGTKHFGVADVRSVTSTNFTWTFNNTTSKAQSNYATGDAGAPSFIRLTSGGVTNYYFAGIVSYGNKAGAKHVQGETRSNTRVDAYAQWVHSIMGDAVPAVSTVDEFKSTFGEAVDPANTNKKITLSGGSTATAASGSTTNVLATRADLDYVKVTVTKAGLANIKYTSTDFDPTFIVYNSSGLAIASADDVALSKANDAVYANLDLAAGDYYIRLSAFHDPIAAPGQNSGKGKGSLTVGITYDEFTATKVGKVTTVTADGNSASQALVRKLTSAGTFAGGGALQSTGDQDWYAFKAVTTGLLQFDVRTGTGNKVDTKIELYTDAAGTVAASAVDAEDQKDDLVRRDATDSLVIDSLASRKTISVTAGQTYYLKITGVPAATSAAKAGLPSSLTGYGDLGSYNISVKPIV